MFYKILEVSTDKASGHTYVLVHFWLSKTDFEKKKPPFRKNDFLMQLRPTGEKVVTNAEGWPKQKDGAFVDSETLDIEKPEPEWEKETYTRDVPAEIKANIEAYWQRALIEPFPFDHASHRIERDESDPHKVLERNDVKALRNAQVEKS